MSIHGLTRYIYIIPLAPVSNYLLSPAYPFVYGHAMHHLPVPSLIY